MSLILSHRSALELHRMGCPAEPFRGSLRSAWASENVNRSFAFAVRDSITQARYLTPPYHFLVPSAVKRASTDDVIFHAGCRELPAGSLRRVGRGVFVVSPECCMRQLACELDVAQLVMLGYELCGSYSFAADGSAAFETLPQTSVGKLRRHAEASQGAHGVKRMRGALSLVGNGSRSPAETAVAMLLGMPHRYGGYGFPAPVLNYRVDPRGSRRALVAQSHFFCDLCWPDRRVAVEYDSDLCHTGAERIARDARRRAGLLALGITAITLTRAQLYDERAFHSFALMLAKRLGYRIRIRCEGFEARRRLLRQRTLY